MSDSFKMVDSISNKANCCLYKWIVESLIQMIHSQTDSFSNETLQCCSETQISAPALFGTRTILFFLVNIVGETKKKTYNDVSQM